MYNINQYLAAAIRCGRIKHYEILDMKYDRHHAETLELGLNKEYLYDTANSAEWQMIIRSILLTLIAFNALDFTLQHSYYSGSHLIDELFTSSILPAYLITFIFELINRKSVKEIASDDVNPDDSSAHNIVISGTFQPFAGYGQLIDTWTFAVNTSLNNTSPEKWSSAFHDEIFKNTSASVKAVFADASCGGKIFMQGIDAVKCSLALPDKFRKPITHADQSIVDSYADDPNGFFRHYYVISESAWNSQLYVTALIKFRTSGDYLFGNVEYYFLPPLKSDLMILDSYIQTNGLRALISTFITCWYSLIPATLYSLRHTNHMSSRIFRNILMLFGINSEMRKKKKIYNYGRRQTLRETCSTENFHLYYQKDDKERISKLMHTAVSDTIIKYLQDKGVDVSDLKQNASIINSGILISGGNIQAGNISSKISEIVTRSFSKARGAKAYAK